MGREASKNLNIERCESPETSFRWTPCLLNPHQADVSESFITGWGEYAQQKKLAILAGFLHSRHQKSYQGTLCLGTQELNPTGSMTL